MWRKPIIKLLNYNDNYIKVYISGGISGGFVVDSDDNEY